MTGRANWSRVTLDEVSDIQSGLTKGRTLDGPSEDVPYLRVANVQAGRLDLTELKTIRATPTEIDRLRLRPDDVVMTEGGDPDKLGRGALWDGRVEQCVHQNHVFRVRVNSERVLPRYFVQFLSSSDATTYFQRAAKQTTGIATINKTQLKALPLLLPPLQEQRRIADILDKADALRAKRRAALAQLDTLTQAIFLDMFGDPVANPKSWPRVPFQNLLMRIEGGTSPICLDRPPSGDEWGVLKLGAVTRCRYDARESKALIPGDQPDLDLEVKVGDLLFTRKNTFDLVGACALVRSTPPRRLIPDLIFRLRPRSDAELDPCYLQQLLTYPTKRRDIQRLAGGTAGSMPNISKGRLENALIELPPNSLQIEFSRRAEKIELLRVTYLKSLAELDALFASLQHRAFRGEL